ncbi:hypothetical protein HanPI659440_Chr08g0296411 [Helianthus annuus]|nr:hypothetical protein HanPI659440_Chr08g0296411 [Helianthus annuus]KAJ0901977.1 hypothetical protein HanPSC8_Chr08g0331621 [Helianthus annuus]
MGERLKDRFPDLHVKSKQKTAMVRDYYVRRHGTISWGLEWKVHISNTVDVSELNAMQQILGQQSFSEASDSWKWKTINGKEDFTV